MPAIHILFDPKHKPTEIRPGPEHEFRIASLTIDDGLRGKDIYDIARRLAELLLEQV